MVRGRGDGVATDSSRGNARNVIARISASSVRVSWRAGFVSALSSKFQRVRITCVGGGPAGLYFSILAKRRFPAWDDSRAGANRPLDTFGWGVVFSDATLENLREADEPTHRAITGAFAHWDDIEIHFKGHTSRSGGHGFCGIARKRLLEILQQRAAELGVELRFETDVIDVAARARRHAICWSARTGSNSRVRTTYASDVRAEHRHRRCRYVWLGTTLPLDAFTFIFERTQHGWFTVHAYRFDEQSSTFIVECREETWLAHGLDTADTQETIAFCERLFEPYLRGHRLMANSAHLRGRDWLDFARVGNERWVHGNVVLVGDAAHTAHFSVGSGTKLAMEDAIAPGRRAVRRRRTSAARSSGMRSCRRIEVLKLQNAARNSTRVVRERRALRRRCRPSSSRTACSRAASASGTRTSACATTAYVDRVEAGSPARVDSADVRAVPAARARSAQPRRGLADGYVQRRETARRTIFTSFISARARSGGAGLVFTEMTCVTREGRISPGCTGMYLPEHVEEWKRIVRFRPRAVGARRSACSSGHSGPKGSTKLMWDGMDEPLDERELGRRRSVGDPVLSAQPSAAQS